MTQDWPKEPWAYRRKGSGGWPTIEFGDGSVTSLTGGLGHQEWERATVCVNALAGIKNPAAIPKLVEWLRQFVAVQGGNTGNDLPYMLAALDAEPEKEPT